MIFGKMGAVKYLVKNDVYCNEWSGAGMFTAIQDVINSHKLIFTKAYLDELLDKASNF